MKINIKKLTAHAEIPTKAHQSDAGYDLYASDYAYNPDHNFWEYGTGVAMSIPEGYVGLLFPRSSVTKKPLMVKNAVGVIDSGFGGEITVRFKTTKDYHDESDLYQVGDRIAQLVVVKCESIEFNQVEKLEESERGTGGYGSSGS